jgi:hypothetical protein
MGYILVKHLDISDYLDDYLVIYTEKLEVEYGEHILKPKEFKGYKNIPYPEPIELNPNPCDEWESKEKEPIPYGYQRAEISPNRPFFYVEFYYKAVE